MLDFSIGLNNTQYLTDLEKSPLWRKLCEIALNKNTFKKEPLSFESLLIHFVAEWSKKLEYDHFGRPSIFTKLLRQIKDAAPEEIKKSLEGEEDGGRRSLARPIEESIVYCSATTKS